MSIYLKKDRLITIRIVFYCNGPRVSPANAYCPLGTLNFSNVKYTDNLLVKNTKLNSAFLIISE